MGAGIETENHVCLIDSSKETISRLSFLVDSILMNARVSIHNSPASVNYESIKQCSLVIISEIMEDMTGTEFIGKLYDSYYMDEMERFPNIIFLTHLSMIEMVERLRYEDIFNKIPSFRILQKPVEPIELKRAITEICPVMCATVKNNIVVPKTLSPVESFLYTMKSVVGIKQESIVTTL